MLRKADLLKKISVKEILFELSKLYMIHGSDRQKFLSEIPKKIEKIEELLHINLFPKNLRS